MRRERVEMRVPVQILQKIEAYQVKNGIATRTAAILELVRKGLEQDEKDEEK